MSPKALHCSEADFLANTYGFSNTVIPRKHIQRRVLNPDRLRAYRRCAEFDFQIAEFRKLRAEFVLSCIDSIEAQQATGSDKIPFNFNRDLADEFLNASDERAEAKTIRDALAEFDMSRSDYTQFVSRLATRISLGDDLFPTNHSRNLKISTE